MTIVLAAAGLAQSVDAGVSLNQQSLGKMLTGIGYETEVKSDGHYTIVIERYNLHYRIATELSEDQTVLWMTTRLADLPEHSRVPASVMEGLLEASHDYAPTFFYICREEGEIGAHRLLNNRGLTPAVIRESVDRFLSSIAATEPVWNSRKWPVGL